MPATVINVSAVEESTARALRFVSEQQDSLNAIDRIINNMEDAWDSDSQKAYAESFRTSREKIENFNRSVNQSIENMRSFVTDCVDADELTAREIRGVSW
ncbi:MAG: WXG100 family type VII secretion target [Synergistaceae bacterium]|nr:WXG100 family type VII secretion target [Synergistaceae bacterium]MBQ6002986.1 WXG100 family type VII secretion target [Synergistaceae bacterium]MBQ6417786.1 WXG100 family type VII secretion target [Synergistaceae bacterium]MBQ6981744.1 WXG100 family type VII secretion target [Synergistaceae bacterium]